MTFLNEFGLGFIPFSLNNAEEAGQTAIFYFS